MRRWLSALARDAKRRDYDDVARLVVGTRHEQTTDLDRIRASGELEIELDVAQLRTDPADATRGQLKHGDRIYDARELGFVHAKRDERPSLGLCVARPRDRHD